MSFKRKLNRAARLKERGYMRYIKLKVTGEDRERIKARSEGDAATKDGLFGQVEILKRLLEVSPKCTGMHDLTTLLRLSRKMEKIVDDKEPVLEIPEDEWTWVKKILDHDQYGKYGPNVMRAFGELLESVENAKQEMDGKLHAVEAK